MCQRICNQLLSPKQSDRQVNCNSKSESLAETEAGTEQQTCGERLTGRLVDQTNQWPPPASQPARNVTFSTGAEQPETASCVN